MKDQSRYATLLWDCTLLNRQHSQSDQPCDFKTKKLIYRDIQPLSRVWIRESAGFFGGRDTSIEPQIDFIVEHFLSFKTSWTEF